MSEFRWYSQEAGLLTVLGVVVVGSGRNLVFEESQQGQEGEKRLGVTDQDGGRFRCSVSRPEQSDVIQV